MDMTELSQAYTKDILEYLTDKLQNEPVSKVMEIAAFIDSKTAVLVCQIVQERDDMWRKEIEKRDDMWAHILHKENNSIKVVK